MRAPVLTLALVAAGCSFLHPKPDRTRYLVLTAQAKRTDGPRFTGTVGLDQLTLPEYLQRPELVSRLQSNELHVADEDRWAEPLHDGVTRTLRADLATRLGLARVLAPPWETAAPPDVTLDVDVRRFERVASGAVELEAAWSVHAGGQTNAHTSRLREPAAHADAQATAAALSRVLDAFAAELSVAVRAAR